MNHPFSGHPTPADLYCACGGHLLHHPHLKRRTTIQLTIDHDADFTVGDHDDADAIQLLFLAWLSTHPDLTLHDMAVVPTTNLET